MDWREEYKKKVVTADEAVKAVKSGDRMIIPLGCGEPETLMEALVKDKDRLRNVEIVGGLMKNYKFLGEGLEGSFHFRTWQCAPPIAKLVGKQVSYMPMRQGDVANLFKPDGPYPIDVSFVHVSPPDKHGFCSLGVSSSHSFPTAFGAKVVVAEVNDNMPRVLGKCFLHVSLIDYFVESSRPLVEFPTLGEIGEIERKIGGYVAELIPDGAAIQVGIGGIPSAVVDDLGGKHNIKILGMGVDSIVDLVERGVISMDREEGWGIAKVVSGEFVGTKKLFDFIHDNPLVEARTATDSLSTLFIAGVKDFISVQSAIEVDIYGQVNIETVRGKQFSAIGGSHDFIQGAYHAPGGKSVIAMLSTTGDGKVSRIVPGFVEGTAVAHPRHSVEYIVTEYGVAYLRDKTLRDRAEALINIAHPDFRDELRKAIA